MNTCKKCKKEITTDIKDDTCLSCVTSIYRNEKHTVHKNTLNVTANLILF